MSAHLSRRSLLGAVPAAGLAGFMAGAIPVSAAAAPSPVMELLAEWKATLAVAEDPATAEDVAERAFNRMGEIENEMVALPSATAQDLAAKICAWSAFGDLGLDGDGSDALWAEMKALVAA